jgi:hypothetical protein
MITLDKIVSSSLELLKDQEAKLQKSLIFVQKAKKLFETQNGQPRRGRKPSERGVRATRAKSIRGVTVRKGSHLANIVNVLKQKGTPVKSGELIDTLFKQQKKDQSIKHYRLLIYPTLTNAYKKGILKLKYGKVHLVV